MPSEIGESRRKYQGPERRRGKAPDNVMPIRLTRKYAEVINDIDLSSHDIGDRIPLRDEDARLLLAEGWAEPVPREERRRDNGIK